MFSLQITTGCFCYQMFPCFVVQMLMQKAMPNSCLFFKNVLGDTPAPEPFQSKVWSLTCTNGASGEILVVRNCKLDIDGIRWSRVWWRCVQGFLICEFDLYSLFCLILLPGTKQSCYGLIWQWDIWLVIYSWCLFEWFLLSVLVCFLVWFRSSFQAHKLILAELLKAGRSLTKGWEVMLKELMFRPSISPLFFPPLTFLHPHPSCLG